MCPSSNTESDSEGTFFESLSNQYFSVSGFRMTDASDFMEKSHERSPRSLDSLQVSLGDVLLPFVVPWLHLIH